MSAVFLVQEIEYIVALGVSDNFMGLILAAEHLTAVDEAWDNQMNFALFHCLGPSIQTALLNAPLAVIAGWGLDKKMSLNFEIFMVVLLVLSILVVATSCEMESPTIWREPCVCSSMSSSPSHPGTTLEWNKLRPTRHKTPSQRLDLKSILIFKFLYTMCY
ncbi:vacuolar H+/Ca2+ exchanger [Penicillium atrosanguineum]|nr:vacuolar H+/Ca2+ exchanger [Penicillium atrosanguineum]